MCFWLVPAVVCGSLTGCFSGPPQIVELNPNRGSVGIAPDAPISVEFDRAVVPGSVAGRFSVSPAIPGCNVNRAFGAGPSAPCRVVWNEADTAFTLLHPLAILRPSYRYRFTLAGGISDPAGVVNSVDHSWDVTTAPAPEVRSIVPADGATAVPVDASISVSFSAAMAETDTASAIHLDPPVDGTRVVRNTRDTSRFVVLPGHPLIAGTSYRLTVSAIATDEHRQPLLSGASVTFTTGGMGAGEHAVILAGRNGEGASTVLVAPLVSAAPGEPVAAEALLTAPRCAVASGCGLAGAGAPLYTYAAANLSPGGRWLAVVEADATVTGPAPVLLVINAAAGSVLTSFADASLPAWSPDGTRLAFSRAGTITVFQPQSAETESLPAGDPLVTAPIWSPIGEQLILDVAPGRGVEHVELADALVLARYPVPGLSGGSSDPVVSPDGSQLAVLRSATDSSAPGTWIAGIGAGAAPPRLLDASLIPAGFTAPGTLVAIDQPASGPPSLVRVSISADGQIPIAHGPDPNALFSLVVSPSGRQLAYLSDDAMGVRQVFVENADGTGQVALTGFATRTVQAIAVALSG